MRLELFLSDSSQLVLIDSEGVKEAFTAEVVLKNVEELRGFQLPARTTSVSQDVADRRLVWRHSGHIIRNAVPNDLAEVAFPLASRARLRVAKAVCVEGSRTVVAADKLARLLADSAFENCALHALFVSLLIRIRTAKIAISQNCTACNLVEEALLEHVETLHVDFLEDQF